MRSIFFIVPVLALAGCAATEPAIEIRTVETVVTRVEKCIAKDDIPTAPSDLGKRPSNDARVLADILLAKVRAWEIFGDKSSAVMRGCAD